MHVDVLHRWLFCCLARDLPAPPAKPRNPAISPDTLRLVFARRQLRTLHRCMTHCSACHFLHQCFQAWRGNLQHAAATGERLQGLAGRLARASFGLAALDKANEGIGRDRADFVRRQTEQAREQGPMEFAHRIRAVLRMGRRSHCVPRPGTSSSVPVASMLRVGAAEPNTCAY